MVNLSSEYVFRGLTQTQGDAAVQAGLNWRRDGHWFAGVWASTVDPNPGPGPTFELNVYAGRTFDFGSDWFAKLVAVHYLYPDDTPALRWDYDEAIASLSFRERLVATVAWSPNSFGFSRGRIVTDRRALTYELAGHLPWRDAWVASAGAGYYKLDDSSGTDYTFWNCGVSYSRAPWQLTVSRYGTDDRAADLYGDELTKDRWSLGLLWRFDGGAR